MDAKSRYKAWLADGSIDEGTRSLLKEMTDAEIEDAFYKNLEFGTGGIRGILGAGTNRMNRYVVGKVAYAIGKLICSEGEGSKAKGVVIAYDVRHGSREFSLISAQIFCAMGIKTYMFDDIKPTPVLSFAVRHLGARAGVVVTASHNPKEYNGYKVYGEDGAQILPDFAEKIEAIANSLEDFSAIAGMPEDEARKAGLLISPGQETEDEYLRNVLSLAMNDDIDKDIAIVYTPLHGTGGPLVMRVLKERGFSRVYAVEEQFQPDPEFSNAPFPNPEDGRAFELAEKKGRETDATILIANDPDCDRTSIMAFDGKDYVYMDGNQTGALLIRYMMDTLEERDMLPENGMIVKTIVTDDLGKMISADYGIKTFEALTGFKNICSVAMDKEKEGYRFLFGYEESIGYNAGTFVRDKDGVTAAMLICESAAFYIKRGKTLYDVMMDIYDEYGFHANSNFSIVLEGRDGVQRIKEIMLQLRRNTVRTIAGKGVVSFTDYMTGEKTDTVTGLVSSIGIPESDVIKIEAEDDLWFAVRPSGTEPKLKFYIYGKAESRTAAKNLTEQTKKEISELLGLEHAGG